MSLFDALFGKPKPAGYARLVMQALRQLGIDDARYDEADFKITLPDQRMLFLHTTYEEYLRAPRAGRQQIVSKFAQAAVDSKAGVPDDLAVAKASLLPRVRERAYHGLTLLQLKLQGLAEKFDQPPSKLLTSHLTVEVCYDTPLNIATVGKDLLTKWNLSLDEALTIARDNLWQRSKANWKRLRSGLFISPWQDSHDASRLFLHDLIWQLEIKGDPVALVPSRDYLVVTGADDAEGLLGAADIAGRIMGQSARAMTGEAVRLDRDHWVTYLPPQDHAAYSALRELQLGSMARDYDEQKHLLEKLNEQEHHDVFVGTFTATKRPDGSYTSYSVWTEGVDTLLPQTEEIMLMKQKNGKAEPDGLASWACVAAAAGDLIEEMDIYPTRHRVRRYPAVNQIAAIDLKPLK